MIDTDRLPNLIGKTNVGYEVVAQKPYGPHDPHLTVVLAQNVEDEQFVVWTYNNAGTLPGYGHGKYTSDYEVAHENFAKRGNW